GPVAAEGVSDLGDEARVLLEPLRPAGVPALVIEHRAPPPRQRGDRHEAGSVRPILEEQTTPITNAIEARPLIGPEAAPRGEVVRALEHVDRVELEAAHVLDEAREPAGRQPLRGRPCP